MTSAPPEFPPYNVSQLQSLLGYGRKVHKRSGGVCEICLFGDGEVDGNLWRQLTVEHVIGEKAGGYPPDWSRRRRVIPEQSYPGQCSMLPERGAAT